MSLTKEEIAAIALWQPTRAGFGRDDPQTAIRIQGIVDRLNSTGDLGCELVEKDGLSNYFILFAYRVADVPSFALANPVDGLLIYLMPVPRSGF